MEERLVAPCGMNCAICSGYMALTHDVKSKGIRIPYCKGCRPRGKECAFLKKHCKLLMEGKVKLCYECPSYPCTRLKGLDKRYRSLFRMSMIENLNFIQKEGITSFLRKEEAKWKCVKCSSVISCHNGICFDCGLSLLAEKKQKYRWEE
ncbi:MAG: DUF3795 domain-containing protein [Candidatus Methanomethylicus sp.]|nr:DUF3795 domain-containing protein [Candidatus Methanomethylicus sp.]